MALIEDGYEDGGENGDGCGVLDASGVAAYEIDQQNQGQQEIGLLQQGQELGQLILAQAPQAQLLGLQVDGDKNTGKVQHSGQDGLDHDGAVGQLDVVRHQESGGAHDGGHDLTAGGGGGLGGSGELRLVAGLLHQGDGDGAGAHGIGYGGAGDHALHGADHNSHLGGAAGHAAHGGVGDVDKEVSDAGALQECAEDDEHHDELRAHADGSGEQALLAVE